ncbi:hypothetical protein [Fangia hongkongensis]|uniref:hypothetical protein n=1 Tax=Fangia hongkongensis TaxID=270495 RepID=UPI00035E81CB|nr:hypothetical protein [Fangia hongkongensis]MBK2124804.1 hypothetical protein [Fangia hongkongensis]
MAFTLNQRQKIHFTSVELPFEDDQQRLGELLIQSMLSSKQDKAAVLNGIIKGDLSVARKIELLNIAYLYHYIDRVNLKRFIDVCDRSFDIEA